MPLYRAMLEMRNDGLNEAEFARAVLLARR